MDTTSSRVKWNLLQSVKSVQSSTKCFTKSCHIIRIMVNYQSKNQFVTVCYIWVDPVTFWSCQTLFVWGPNRPCLPGHLEVPSDLLYFWFDESEIPRQRVSNIFAKPESFRRLAWVSGIFRNYLDNQEKIRIIWRVIRCWESVSKKVIFFGFRQV